MIQSRIRFIAFLLVLPLAPTFTSSNEFHADFDNVLKAYVSDGKVNYTDLKKNRAQLDAYLAKLASIHESTFVTWSEKERLAYLINLYNAATLQLVINHYPVRSIKRIRTFFKGPWDQPVVSLFDKKITLKNLENDIIRKEYKEPRIHMALVCAAKGCPPLRMEPYMAERLDNQLDDQSKEYLSSPVGMRIDEQERKVYLSSIFKWYQKDFPSVVAFAEKYSGVKLDGFSVHWLDYDWSLNGK